MKNFIFCATAFLTLLFFSCNKSSENEIDSLETARDENFENVKPSISVTNPDGTKTQYDLTKMPIDEKAMPLFMRFAEKKSSIKKESEETDRCCDAFVTPYLQPGAFFVEGVLEAPYLGNPFVNVFIGRYTEFQGMYYYAETLSWTSYSNFFCHSFRYNGTVPCDGGRHAIFAIIYYGIWSYDTNAACSARFVEIPTCMNE
jgi:hypothetical protein